MKPRPNYDFPIAVIPEWVQSDEKEDLFFKGIYTLTLNYEISVVFVPFFERVVSNWPPKPPNPNSEVFLNSIQDARMFSITHTQYSVTPDMVLAGQEEILQQTLMFFGEEIERHRVIFYISPAQFEQLSQDIAQIYERMYAEGWNTRLGIPISHLNTYAVIEFLLSRIINSPYLTDYQMKMLGRPRKNPGN